MQVGTSRPGWRPRTRSGRSSRLTIRTHNGVRLTVVRLSGVVETIVDRFRVLYTPKVRKLYSPSRTFLRACKLPLSTNTQRVGKLSNLFSAPVLDGLSTTSSKWGRQLRSSQSIRPDPDPNTRQHERGVNKRRQRIRKRKRGAPSQTEGVRPVSKPMISQLENGWKS